MACVCGSSRIAMASGKTCDQFFAKMSNIHDGKEYDGYVLPGLGVGKGDYMEFEFCLDCGRIQGKFPVKPVREVE